MTNKPQPPRERNPGFRYPFGIAAAVAYVFTPSTAFAHQFREPGSLGWVKHMFEAHTLDAVIISAIVGAIVWAIIYRTFLEPDWKKAERKRRKQDGSGCGSGCSSGGGSSGCSGCGGD